MIKNCNVSDNFMKSDNPTVNNVKSDIASMDNYTYCNPGRKCRSGSPVQVIFGSVR